MKDTTTSHAGSQPTGAQARWENPSARYELIMNNEMINRTTPEKPLPFREDRRKIIEQAKLVLAKARAVAQQLDESFAAGRGLTAR
jgi:hypothetical protein